jgi:hypothetical protein
MRSILTFKAFGDFLIAVNVPRFLKTSDSIEPISLIAAHHVRQLAGALEISESRVEYISDSVSSDVPVIYDVKKRGVIAALKSLQNIRRLVDRIPHDAEFIFDNYGWRERIIASGRRVYQLPTPANNIYLAYDNLFKNMGYIFDLQYSPSLVNIRRALIVPRARMNFRVISSLIISNIYNELAARGIEVEVVLLEHEEIEVPRNLRVRVIPRSFIALVDSIRSSDLVVSADSLPSHLSAYLDVPIFVFSPIPEWTTYWLPKTAYLSQGMATFSNIEPFRVWLDRKSNS